MTQTPDNAGQVELLPCPFCGQQGKISDRLGWVICQNNKCTGSTISSDAWNTRTAPPNQTALIEVGRFGRNIHGHLHHVVIKSPHYINVSCEQINCTPIALEELA